jgi:hypothetical protein
MTAAISVGGVVADLLRKKLRANKADLIGYWQTYFFRERDYPHGVRDRQDAPDTTGNALIDYAMFGCDKEANLGENDLSNGNTL